MKAQMLFNQIKALLELEFHWPKVENDKLKKENQEIKESFSKLCQLCKVDSEYPLQNGIDDKKQSDNYRLIDLGLPSGTLWMDRNIGAKSPTDFGLYFAWGETTGYTADEIAAKTKDFASDNIRGHAFYDVHEANGLLFCWQNYKYANGDGNKITKYCIIPALGDNDYTDNLTILEMSDDAAYQFTNGECKMPTAEQIMELRHYTTYEWTTMDGVKGGLFTSKTNCNSIFVPADSDDYGTVYGSFDSTANIWSSSLDKRYHMHLHHSSAWSLKCDEQGTDCHSWSRHGGLHIRGIKSK